MIFLALQFNILKWLGIFPSNNTTVWTLRALNVYRVIIFILLSSVIFLMTVQMFMAPDLTILARSIDLYTMFFSGLYKWLYMMIFNKEFSKFFSKLIPMQSQGSIAYGQSAKKFTKNYLRFIQQITSWYLCSGVITVLLNALNPLFTYQIG